MGLSIKRSVLIATAAVGVSLAGCGQVVPPHLKPIPPEAKALLAKKGMREDAPIFIRIFKEENELEIWKAKADGEFHHFKTYPICNWSGKLGPKFKQGDKQAPEGFYKVSARQMNPNSSFHLSFNLGYPNAFDKSHKRTGDYLMVHGDCRSAGCYAMTDALIEEIYAFAREAFAGGQKAFDVHAYPFRMTVDNMRRHSKNKHYAFWRNNLYQGYKDFENTKLPPKVDVCERRYLVNVSFNGDKPKNPAAACPTYQRLPVEQIPRPPMFQEAKRKAPMSPAPQNRADASSPAPAAQASIASGSTFGFAPPKPSVAGFAFRLNSTLSR
ncbi:MAG: murein L,D-transpeptidase [Hyphomicrobiaceae bacterium]|nr:murein L,D-transpeptidase [Hyphomicrobiaceae bacterium]